jgi:hypothetical protein
VLKPRQIVGVHRGQISLNTSGADHLMVISTAPIVLGNVPPEEFVEAYEMVAFRGQVPVDVIGEVRAGDYIIPSGDNDGFGLAVHPEDMDYRTMDQVVGVAWEDGLNDYFNTVNTSIGIGNSALSLALDGLKNEMDEFSSQMDLFATTHRTTEPALEAQLTPRLASSQPDAQDKRISTQQTSEMPIRNNSGVRLEESHTWESKPAYSPAQAFTGMSKPQQSSSVIPAEIREQQHDQVQSAFTTLQQEVFEAVGNGEEVEEVFREFVAKRISPQEFSAISRMDSKEARIDFYDALLTDIFIRNAIHSGSSKLVDEIYPPGSQAEMNFMNNVRNLIYQGSGGL